MNTVDRHTFKSPLLFWQRAFYLIVVLVITTGMQAQARLKVRDNKQSFGFVRKGEVVTLHYIISNTGNEGLEIFDAKAECSCTTIDFPKYPIKPGQTDTVTVYFDTKSAYDRQDRIVELISNTGKPPQKLRFKGVVLK